MKVKDHFLTKEIFEIKETNTTGVLKTYPIPTDIYKYYDSKKYISHHQDNGSIKEIIYKTLQNINLKYKRNIIQKHIQKHQKNYTPHILDYGCGAGDFVKYIQKNYKTYGYEPNNNAKKYAQQKNKNTTFSTSHTLEDIENNSLDAITLWHVLEHIENQNEIINIFYKKLKQNGKLIIAVPNHNAYDAKYYKEYWAAYDVPRHIYHFSKQGMINTMNNQQWKITHIAPLLLDAFYISILSEKYKKNPLFWLFGTVRGAISNFKAYKTGDFSSLIYIIEKK